MVYIRALRYASECALFAHHTALSAGVKHSFLRIEKCALGYKQAAASLTGRLTPPRHPRRFAPRAPTKRTHKQIDCPDLRPFHPVIRRHDTANLQRGGTGVCAEPLANRPSFAAVRLCPCRIGCVFRPCDRSFVGSFLPKKRQSLSHRVTDRHARTAVPRTQVWMPI